MSRKALRGLALIGAAGLMVWVAGAASARTQANLYGVNALVSDSAATPATGADASLVNGWGLTAGPTTPWWAANNGTSTSTLYNGAGAKQALTVAVAGGPTGAVFNGSATDFVVSQNGQSGAARFLFATESGTIAGWSPAVNANTAVTGADRSGSGAIYKGLAVANDKLFATDFHNRRVDVFDKSFNRVRGSFSDPRIPKGFAPFGIQALGRQHLRDLRQAGRREEGRRPGTGAGIRRRVHSRRRADRPGREFREEERAAERSLGPRTRAGRLRRLLGRSARRRTSETAGSAPTRSAAPSGSTRASSAAPTAPRSQSTDSGRSRSATARRRADEHALLPLRPVKGEARSLRLDPRKLISELWR